MGLWRATTVPSCTADVDNGLFFVASKSSSKVEWMVPLDEEGGSVVAMEWRVEVEAVVVSRSSGQVVEVSDSRQEVQEVGALQGGLLAMAASPDGELLLLATRQARRDLEDVKKLVCWKASGTVCTLKLGWRSAVLESSTALVTRRHHINLNVILAYGGWKSFCTKVSEFYPAGWAATRARCKILQ